MLDIKFLTVKIFFLLFTFIFLGLVEDCYTELITFRDKDGVIHVTDGTSSKSKSDNKIYVSQKYRVPGKSLDYQEMISEISKRYGVDEKLTHAVIKHESSYNPRAVSSKGAQGIMQLIPSTQRRFGVRDAFNPRQNIEGGVKYLKHLMGLFGSDLRKVLAGYNAGENAVMKYNGIPPYDETVDYVRNVMRTYYIAKGEPIPNLPEPSKRSKEKEREEEPIRVFRDKEGVLNITNVPNW